MNDVIFWLLTLYFIGLAAIPFAYYALPSLIDRGFGLVRPIGMLLFGALIWLLSLLRLLPNVGWSWWAVAIIIAVCGWGWLLLRDRSQFWSFLRRRWLQLLITEALFILFFGLFVVLKASDPDVTHTEKPMDLMMLNAVMAAQHAPPTDLWLSGFPIAYYYFGYWMFGGIAQMASVPASIAFSLAIATIGALSAAAIFSLVGNLTRRDGSDISKMVLAGLAAVVLLLLISNLNGIWELMTLAGVGTEGFYQWLGIKGVDLTDPGTGWRPEGWWWWFASSRIINRILPDGTQLDFTIQEFPFFSIMLGDLHPHLLSIPFVLLGISLIANVLFSPKRWGLRWLRHYPVTALLLVLTIGASGFINTWDLGWILLAFGAVVYSKSYAENGRSHLAAIKAAVPPYLLLGAAGAIFFSNYYFWTMESQIQYPPLVPTKLATRPIHFFTVWGGLLAVGIVFAVSVSAPVLASEWLTRTRLSATRLLPASIAGPIPWLISLALVIGLYGLWAITHLSFNDDADPMEIVARLPLSGLIGIAFIVLFVTTYRRAVRGADDGVQAALILLTVSLLLLYVAELMRMHDLFGGRHNTVFKFYYQVWIFFAVAGGYAVFYWMRKHPQFSGRARYFSIGAGIVAAVLITGSLYYPAAAPPSKAAESDTQFTLDGLAFLERQGPEIPEAMAWLRENVSNDDVIVEASGGSYSHYGRFSGFTGRPAILGWTGHQGQWRGSDEAWAERDKHLDRIYNSSDVEEVRRSLELYDADYLVLSPNERDKYTELDDSKFDLIGGRVFENDKVIIFALGD